jgi:small subunit ribosomal protein S20
MNSFKSADDDFILQSGCLFDKILLFSLDSEHDIGKQTSSMSGGERKLPNIKSAIKRVKINESKHARNAAFKSSMRTAMKKFELAVEQSDENASELFREAVKKLDKAVTKGIIHKNTANRQKARLAKKLNQLGA